MGRCKIQMKKIENTITRQVTYSKRKSGLLKKAYEISTLCDTDVALMMFSPSGRLTCFSNTKRIEDVFCRYLDMPQILRAGMIQNEEFVRETPQKLISEQGVDSPDSPSPEETAAIEMLRENVIKVQRDIAVAQTKLSFFEPDVSKVTSLHEIESREKFLIDTIAGYEKRLKELEGEQHPSAPPAERNHHQKQRIASSLPSQTFQLPPAGLTSQAAVHALSASQTNSWNQKQGGFGVQQPIPQTQNEGSVFHPHAVLHSPGPEDYMQIADQFLDIPLGFADVRLQKIPWNAEAPLCNPLDQQYVNSLTRMKREFDENLKKQNGPSTSDAGPSNPNFRREPAGKGAEPTGTDLYGKPVGTLQDVRLEKFVNATSCLPREPMGVKVRRGVSAGTFVDNPAVRNFIYRKPKATAIGMGSAGIALVFAAKGSFHCLQEAFRPCWSWFRILK